MGAIKAAEQLTWTWGVTLELDMGGDPGPGHGDRWEKGGGWSTGEP